MQRALQDLIAGNHCWGCGPANQGGLQIKSYPGEGDEVVCTWQPHAPHSTWIQAMMNGGVIATIMDCHSIWTAMAAAHRAEGRAVGTAPHILYVTASIQVDYRRPTPIHAPVTLRARVAEAGERKSIVVCSLVAAGRECVRSELVAVRIADGWGQHPSDE